MLSDRPPKLPAIALGVFWGCPELTLGEVVVCYHDWILDQGGPDGSYISHESLAARLANKLKAGTISRIRQRLKRLTLHETIRRKDARNLGWVTTLPRVCVPRTYHEIPALAIALGKHLRSLTTWSEQNGLDSPDEMDARVQTGQTPESDLPAAALGGRGEISFSVPVRQAQLPSMVREKGVGARAPELQKREERDPAVVRAEGFALIHLQQGKKLTPEERHLVDEWLKRQPPDRRKAMGG